MPASDDKKIVIYWSTKKTISLVCAVLLIPVFVLFVFSLTVKTTILNTDYYLNNLKKVDAYNRLINEGIPSLILDSQISDNELTDSFAKQLAIFVIQKSLSPEWVENQTNNLVHKIVELSKNYKEGITLDLTDTKQVIDRVSTGLMIFDNMLPECNTSSSNKNLLGTVMDEKTSCEVKTDLEGIRNQVDKINLGVVNLDSQIKNANAFISSVQHFSTNIKIFFWSSLALLIILLGTIIALEFSDWRFVVKTVSIPLIVASVLTFFAALIVKSIVSTAYVGVNNNPSGPIKAITGDFISASVSGIFNRLEIISAIVFGVFATAFILVEIYREKK